MNNPTSKRLSAIMAKLHHASDLVLSAMVDMDTTEEKCDKCGINKKHNFVEAKAAKELRAIIHRLENISDTIKHEHGDSMGVHFKGGY